MGKKIPATFDESDNDGRHSLREGFVDEETGEEVQPDDVRLSASEKPTPKFPDKKGK